MKTTKFLAIFIALFSFLQTKAQKSDTTQNKQENPSALGLMLERSRCAKAIDNNVSTGDKTFIACYKKAASFQESVPCLEKFSESLTQLKPMLINYSKYPAKADDEYMTVSMLPGSEEKLSQKEALDLIPKTETLIQATKKYIEAIKNNGEIQITQKLFTTNRDIFYNYLNAAME